MTAHAFEAKVLNHAHGVLLYVRAAEVARALPELSPGDLVSLTLTPTEESTWPGSNPSKEKTASE